MKQSPDPSTTGDTIAAVAVTPTEGTAAIHTVDRVQRRLQEQIALELLEQSYRNLTANECHSGNRQGYEIR